MAIAESVKDGIWMRRIMRDLKLSTEEPTTIYEDNQGTIAVSLQSPGEVSSRTKHIAVRYFFIRQHVEDGDFEVIYCNTDDMIADVFTKPLGNLKFLKFREMLGVLPQ